MKGGGKWADSDGISGTGETPEERSDEEAHRPPRGKRPISRSPSLLPENKFFKKQKRGVDYASPDSFSLSSCRLFLATVEATTA